jgi:hypothetical protein
VQRPLPAPVDRFSPSSKTAIDDRREKIQSGRCPPNKPPRTGRPRIQQADQGVLPGAALEFPAQYAKRGRRAGAGKRPHSDCCRPCSHLW